MISYAQPTWQSAIRTSPPPQWRHATSCTNMQGCSSFFFPNIPSLHLCYHVTERKNINRLLHSQFKSSCDSMEEFQHTNQTLKVQYTCRLDWAGWFWGATMTKISLNWQTRAQFRFIYFNIVVFFENNTKKSPHQCHPVLKGSLIKTISQTNRYKT